MSEDYKRIKSRVKTVEEAVQMLTDMAIRGDERMDSHDASLSNLTVKLEALADAQIRTEESLKLLTDSHVRLEEGHLRLQEAHTRLAESQVHTDKRLDALIDIVRGEREGRNGK